MNKDQAISGVLTTALEAAKKTGSWLQGQLPDVVHQLIAWNITEDAILLTAALVVVGGYAYWAKRCAKNEVLLEDGYCFVTIVGGVLATVCAFSVLVNTLDLVELLVAPKIWLLEYAAHLVK